MPQRRVQEVYFAKEYAHEYSDEELDYFHAALTERIRRDFFGTGLERACATILRPIEEEIARREA